MADHDPTSAATAPSIEHTLRWLPTPLILVTAAAGARRNVMMAVRLMHWDDEPHPSILVGVHGRSLTGELMRESGEFAVHILSAAQADLLHKGRQLARVSSEEVDKFASYGLETVAGSVIQAPLVAGCAVSVECRLRRFVDLEEVYSLAIGDVVALHADSQQLPVVLLHRLLYPLREALG